MASTCDTPHGDWPVGRIVIVESLWLQELLDGMGGLEGVVTWHLVEQVVHDVGATNAVVEKVENSVVAVNGGKSTADPGPFAFAVVWDGRIGVLQPGVENQPCVNKVVRSPVPADDWGGTVFIHGVAETGEDSDLSKGREHDLRSDLV